MNQQRLFSVLNVLFLIDIGMLKITFIWILFLPSSGCDHVIDKSTESLWEAAESHSPKGFQVVFDANGVETLQESYNHVAPGGKLVVYGMC